MEIQQLEYFKMIAECGSLTKAAQKLHTSQPSLSRSLRALEDELGTPLFDRVGRNIVLNSAGQVALDKCVAVLNATNAIKHDVTSFVNEKNLSVDVYSPVPMGDSQGIITSFKKENPDVRIRLARYQVDSLKDMTPNITFFASQIVHKEPNCLLLGDEEIALACSKDHPLASSKSVRLADLSHEAFIKVLPSALLKITDSMFYEAGFKPITVMEEQDYAHVLSYVSKNLGITLAPSITWYGVQTDNVVFIPISDVHRRRFLYLKWPENVVPNSATLRFREHLVNYYNKNFGFNCSG